MNSSIFACTLRQRRGIGQWTAQFCMCYTTVVAVDSWQYLGMAYFSCLFGIYLIYEKLNQHFSHFH